MLQKYSPSGSSPMRRCCSLCCLGRLFLVGLRPCAMRLPVQARLRTHCGKKPHPYSSSYAQSGYQVSPPWLWDDLPHADEIAAHQQEQQPAQEQEQHEQPQEQQSSPETSQLGGVLEALAGAWKANPEQPPISPKGSVTEALEKLRSAFSARFVSTQPADAQNAAAVALAPTMQPAGLFSQKFAPAGSDEWGRAISDQERAVIDKAKP